MVMLEIYLVVENSSLLHPVVNRVGDIIGA